VPLVENDRADLARLDLAATAPEDVRVLNRNADAFQVAVDGRLVGEHGVLVGAVDDAHDVDVGEAFAALAPVAVGHDRVATHLGAAAFLHALGHLPVEEGVEAGDADAGRARLDVLKEGRKATDDALFIEALGDL